MLASTMHPEDIKAAIRKRHGSLRAFVEAKGLPNHGVIDFLRGRTSQRVSDEIERLLQDECSESREMDSGTGQTLPQGDPRKAVNA